MLIHASIIPGVVVLFLSTRVLPLLLAIASPPAPKTSLNHKKNYTISATPSTSSGSGGNRIHNHQKKRHPSDLQSSNLSDPQPIKWGTTFVGPVSLNVPLECLWDGKPVCCSLTSDKVLQNDVNFHVSSDEKKTSTPPIKQRHLHCTTNITYFPSFYETDQIAQAIQLSNITDFATRRRAFLELITSQEQLAYAKSWLERVRVRMHQGRDQVVLPSVNDSLLSKFVSYKRCSDGTVTQTEDFIEPLTIHARHPFAFTSCYQNERYAFVKAGIREKTAVQSLDYILLASSASIDKRQEAGSTGTNAGTPGTGAATLVSSRPNKRHKNLMFDCGTSSFSSSLSWFTCAYLQQNVTFDHMFGWEATLLDPTHFWSEVPPKLKHTYSFMNIPIHAGQDHPDNPLNFIRRTALDDDFVSFKLDVDTPEVEIPIALELSRQKRLYSVIDEFFFELHFRCELMMFCGWTEEVAEEVDGFRLDRVNAMKFFQDLRFKGVRAHFWP